MQSKLNVMALIDSDKAYSIYLMIELAKVHGIIPKELEYDLTYKKGEELYEAYEKSVFNVDTDSEYNCIEAFLTKPITYRVEVTRKTESTMWIEVKAFNEEDAGNKAIEAARLMAFVTSDVNYEYNDMAIVTSNGNIKVK